MKIRGYITHKAAEKFSDCADYYKICPRTNRVAVSDGVSQSTMPLEWAKILVDAFVNNEWKPGDDLASLKSKWLNDARSFLNRQKEQGVNNWMLENNLLVHDGAGATFCGLTFTEPNMWSASILGDTCLVIVNKDNHIDKVIASKEGDFDNRPDYFDSFGDQRGVIREEKGVLDENCFLLLVSDPFSELFHKIKNTKDETVVISKILGLNSFEDFSACVDYLRDNYGMHNDDSTIAIVEYDGTTVFTSVNEKTLESLVDEEEKKEDEELWKSALYGGSIDSYKKYIRESISHRHDPEAHEAIRKLEEINRIAKLDDDDWLAASKTNSIKGYGEYLSSHPDGQYHSKAIERLHELDIRQLHTKKPEGKDEKESEPSSEDPVCSSSGKKNPETEKIVNDDNVREADQTAQTIGNQSNEPRSSSKFEVIKEGGKAEGRVKEVYAKTKSPELPPKSETAPATIVYGDKEEFDKEQMGGEGEIEEQCVTDIAIPKDVDPSDGIDLEEFKNLQLAAELLFRKFHSPLENAFAVPKWKADRSDNINSCFRKFWSELGELIFKEKNNA